ncbi:MAG: hypothetical protein KDD84_03520 [Caldilineaceae bacterium]|nr:hypothetical protein [Caldilineaceae bacterium]
MFVRWVVRGHKNAEIVNVTFHDAYLVESYRDEQGEPRQRTVAYLGNVRQIGQDFPAIERGLFLLRTQAILASIEELTAADREQTLEQIQKRIPPLDGDEMMVGFVNTLRWYYRWWQTHDSVPSDEEILRILQHSQDTSHEIIIDNWG